jgi:hypothetical protein
MTITATSLLFSLFRLCNSILYLSTPWRSVEWYSLSPCVASWTLYFNRKAVFCLSFYSFFFVLVACCITQQLQENMFLFPIGRKGNTVYRSRGFVVEYLSGGRVHLTAVTRE